MLALTGEHADMRAAGSCGAPAGAGAGLGRACGHLAWQGPAVAVAPLVATRAGQGVGEKLKRTTAI